MIRCAIFVGLCAWSALVLADEPCPQLPKPHYHRQPSDPQWLVDAVQFHGHLGPAAIAGVRVGMAGLRAVDAKGYFDVDITCEGPMAAPPQSCFLDGLQVGTGATLGKRSLHWVESQQVMVRFKNTKTGKSAQLSLTPALLELVPAFAQKPTSEKDHDDHSAEDRLESVSRKIAAMPENELAVVTADKTPAK
jgi:formylmethanofuran dehydrogenase subunit E